MTIPAQSAEISLALQPGKVGKKGTFNPASLNYTRMSVVVAGFGAIQDSQTLPPETGATIVPRDEFKQMLAFGGQSDLLPRIEGSLGLLLLGALGSVTTTENTDVNGNPVTGLHTHRFRFHPSSSYRLPWMSWRVKTPGLNSVHDYGQTGFDCMIANLRLNMPGMGKIGVTVGIQGRDVTFDDASGWSYVGTTEDGLSIPETGSGFVKIGGTEYPIVGMTFDVVNALTRFQDEMVHGSMRPDHFISTSRVAQVRVMYKYENPALISRIYTRKASVNSVWEQSPFYTETNGTEKAFEAHYYAPGMVGNTGKRYGLHVFGSRVSWRVEGPIQIQAGRFLIVPFTGTFILPDEGEEYVEAVLENDQVAAFYQVANPITVTMATTANFSGTALKLDAAAAVSQYANSGWSNGALIASFGTPTTGTLTADDVLSVDVSGNFSMSGDVLSYENPTPIVIGTVEGGTPTAPLTIVFNDNVTTAIVQELARAIQYNNTAGANSGDSFPVIVRLVDINSEVATKTITITHA